MDWKQIRPWILPNMPRSALGEPLEIASGLLHYRRQRDGQYVRYHLRVERSGQSLLIVAASEAARLTRSGTIAAYGILEGKADAQIRQELAGLAEADQVIAEVRALINTLGLRNKRYPIFNLADPLSSENPQGLIAPFQADVELGEDASKLRSYLRSLWEAGIPHVRFVNVDWPQQLNDSKLSVLYSAVQYAEDIGMIAGVRMKSGGFLSSDTSGKLVVDRLAEHGLDYAVVPWAVEPDLHEQIFGGDFSDQLKQLIQRGNHWEFPVLLDACLVVETVDSLEEQLDKAIAQGVSNFEVFPVVQASPTESAEGRIPNSVDAQDASRSVDAKGRSKLTPFQPQHLKQLASWIEDLADNRRAQIIWLPAHSSLRPLGEARVQQFFESGPRAGADVSIRVNVNGHVYPPRGPRNCVGTIDQVPWSEIWNHASFRRFRELVARVDHCDSCPMLTTCAAHCPADSSGWAIED